MAIQLDFWSLQEIDRLEKKVATLNAEVVNLREENERLAAKRMGKRAYIALAKRYYDS